MHVHKDDNNTKQAAGSAVALKAQILEASVSGTLSDINRAIQKLRQGEINGCVASPSVFWY
jgi:hypothetical protein